MAIISDHHWADRAAGLREMCRVARERVVIVNVDPSTNHDFGFMSAYWRRPDAYLDPAVRAAISVFQLLPEAEVREAVDRLRRDLEDGTWARRNADLLDREELDVGLRLVVGRL